MVISRRDFLSGILAGAAAPAVVKASSLMALKPKKLIIPNQDIIIPSWNFVFETGIPKGWVCCDGQELDHQDYHALFKALLKPRG